MPMIIYALLLIVPMLLWAAMGFQGLGKRTSNVVRIAFISLMFVGASAYTLAQAADL